MSNTKKDRLSITLDQRTRKRLDKFAEEHSLSRSAVIRYISNEFFNKGDFSCGIKKL